MNHRRPYTAHACSKETTITAAEADFAAQFGLSPREICGRAVSDLLQAGAPGRLRHRFTDLCEGRTDCLTERVTGRHGSDRVLTASLTAIAITGPAGLAGIVLLLHPLGKASEPHPHELTLSQLDARLLEGLASGASTAALAARLYLSRQGIEYRVTQLLRRFDAANRPALVGRAHSLGLFVPGQWPSRVRPELIA
ncbi:PAS domain-containing protein [Streptomyces sp. NPDC127108]|uniref:PAS domain-containing protein n=1 Tax=Streptomyces sp. NPDC127108 TaxID=3345361 RepID=UPI0036447AAB